VHRLRGGEQNGITLRRLFPVRDYLLIFTRVRERPPDPNETGDHIHRNAA